MTLFDRLIVSCLRRIGSNSTINGGTLCEVWRKCVCTYLSLYVIRKCTLISQLLAKGGGGLDSGIHKAKLSFVVFLHVFFSLEIWKCGRGQWGSFTQTQIVNGANGCWTTQNITCFATFFINSGYAKTHKINPHRSIIAPTQNQLKIICFDFLILWATGDLRTSITGMWTIYTWPSICTRATRDEWHKIIGYIYLVGKRSGDTCIYDECCNNEDVLIHVHVFIHNQKGNTWFPLTFAFGISPLMTAVTKYTSHSLKGRKYFTSRNTWHKLSTICSTTVSQ